MKRKTARAGWRWGAAVAVLVAVPAIIVIGRLGPPQVTMTEAYADQTAEPGVEFDHGAFDGLLQKHVDDAGRVDYAALDRERKTLGLYLESIAAAPIDKLSRDGKLSLLINAYNAYTLELILMHWDGGRLESIRDIDGPWDQVRWTIASKTYSLNQIEHELIRPRFKEPRIHFALVCAAVGCPKLRREAYVPARLEPQLADQMVYAHANSRWFRYDASRNVVSLTKLYDWYGDDFKQHSGSVLAYVAAYSPELAKHLKTGPKPKIEWLDYDWKLNRR